MPPDPSTPPARWQFPLSYLLYVTTVFAIGFALVRSVFAVPGGWLLTVTALVYISALIAYFALRFPFLLRRWRRATAKIEQGQDELRQFADDLQSRKP